MVLLDTIKNLFTKKMILILLLVARLINSEHINACPHYSQDAICEHYERQCNTNDDCKYGDMCCSVECGTKCITIHESHDVCRLQPDEGHCKGYFRRYYYDYNSKVCYRFIYGGCGGNKNNFETLEECEERCKRTEKPPCLSGCQSPGPTKPTDPVELEPLPPASEKPPCLIGCPSAGPPKPPVPREPLPPGSDPCRNTPKCAAPPPGVCTEPAFRIIDGVRCPWCYNIVPCEDKKCPEVPVDYICHAYSNDCKDDSYCTDGKKCCRQGCSFVCVNPV